MDQDHSPSPGKDRELAELLRQIELVRQHLAWLESRLHQAEASPKSVSETASTVAPQINPTEETTTEEIDATLDDSGESASQARTGCLVLATVIVLLMLFLLFGLPFLIY